MYPVFSTSLFLLILGTTSFPGTLNFIGELFNMISLSIVDVVFNGLFVTSIPLTTSYSLFLFKRSCGNIYLNYRNQTMDVSRLYLWIPSAALFPLTEYIVDIGTTEGNLLYSFLGHIRLHIDHFCYNPIGAVVIEPRWYHFVNLRCMIVLVSVNGVSMICWIGNQLWPLNWCKTIHR